MVRIGFVDHLANQVVMNMVIAVHAQNVFAARGHRRDLAGFGKPFVLEILDELPRNSVLLLQNAGSHFAGSVRTAVVDGDDLEVG
jgi:hypothetical protein